MRFYSLIIIVLFALPAYGQYTFRFEFVTEDSTVLEDRHIVRIHGEPAILQGSLHLPIQITFEEVRNTLKVVNVAHLAHTLAHINHPVVWTRAVIIGGGEDDMGNIYEDQDWALKCDTGYIFYLRVRRTRTAEGEFIDPLGLRVITPTNTMRRYDVYKFKPRNHD